MKQQLQTSESALPKLQKPKGTKSASRARAAVLVSFAAVILASILVFFLAGSSVAAPYTYTDNTKVLLYHLVSDETYGPNEYLFVRISDFEAQLAEIKRLGYKTVFADELAETRGEPCVVLTFDDGYADNYTNVLPLLEKYDMKATIFLISDLIGTEGHLNEEQILEMQESGHIRFASHTKTHQNLAGIDKETLEGELAESRRRLEELTGEPVRALAYPSGAYDSLSELVAAECGYEYCYTTEHPTCEYYPNTRLPRSYVVRDMAMSDFLRLLE